MSERIVVIIAMLVVAGLVACGDGGSPREVTGAPTNVMAEPGDGFIWVSWEFDGTPDAFEVFREDVTPGSLQVQELSRVASVAGDERQFYDMDVVPGTRYRYAVAKAGEQHVQMVGEPKAPNPGISLRVNFAGPAPEDSSIVIASEPAGIECRRPGDPGCVAVFPSISEVELFAAESDGFEASWSGCDATSSGACSVNMAEGYDPAGSKQRTVEVSFSEAASRLEITVDESGSGRVVNSIDLGSHQDIDCTGVCSYTYPSSLIVSLSAQPIDEAHHRFTGWGGACAGSATSTCNVTMDANRSVVAEFELVPPRIESFVVGPDRVDSGESVDLSWEVTGGGDISTGALVVSIEPGVGAVESRSGSSTAFPDETTTYVLKVTNASGSVSASRTVIVGEAPSIGAFSANPAFIDREDASQLEWSVDGPGEIALAIDQGVGDVTGQSSVVVAPDETTTYTLTATNEFGSTTAKAVVYVGDAPRVIEFSASPTHIRYWERSTLSWILDEGDGDITVSIDRGIGDVTGESSVTVSPDQATEYTLTASNPYGSDSATVKVRVVGAPRDKD